MTHTDKSARYFKRDNGDCAVRIAARNYGEAFRGCFSVYLTDDCCGGIIRIKPCALYCYIFNNGVSAYYREQRHSRAADFGRIFIPVVVKTVNRITAAVEIAVKLICLIQSPSAEPFVKTCGIIPIEIAPIGGFIAVYINIICEFVVNAFIVCSFRSRTKRRRRGNKIGRLCRSVAARIYGLRFAAICGFRCGKSAYIHSAEGQN